MATLYFGTDASCSGPTVGLFNAFTLSITQGIAQAIGFGEIWMHTRGTACSISASMSGFVESGTTGNLQTLGSASGLSRTGSKISLYFGPSSSALISFTGIQTGIGLDAQFLGNSTISVGFTGDGAPTVTWTA